MEVLADPSDGLGWGSAGGQDHGSAAPTIADEQAALRRVATLVARGVSPAQLFAAVAQEVGNLFPDAAVARVGRYVTGSAVDCVGGWSRDGDTSWVGDRVPIAGHNSASLVFERNAPVRIERLTDDGTSATTLARASGTRSGVGAPIVVAGRLWGVMTLGFGDIDVLPPDIEYRLADFTDLIAIAIANIEAREELRRVANEQAALRRIATLVARGVSPAEVFAGVAQEVGAVFTEAEVALVGRYVDGDLEFVGGWSTEGPPSWVGTRVPLGGRNVATIVHERNEAVRVDHLGDDAAPATILARSTGSRAAAGAPIIVAGRLWGVVTVGSAHSEQLPRDVEHRLAQFTDLIATALANAEASEELRDVAEEQAALRQVATLVAEGAPPDVVFASVAEEVGRLLHGDSTVLARFYPDEAIVVATWGNIAAIPVGMTWPIIDGTISKLVRDTQRPARLRYAGEMEEPAAALGIRRAVGAPITVGGRIWGVMTVAWMNDDPAPPGTETRLAEFTEFVGTAIANAQAQADLTASRARIVATADETRRRIERDLHDGAQQRLLTVALRLRAAQARIPRELDELAHELDAVTSDIGGALDELREYARGIHPAILSKGGLAAAMQSLARRSAVPVQLDVEVDERLPEPIEVGTYYIVSEALTNAVKHARATHITVNVALTDDHLRITVRDDGVGGADMTHGSGLIGLKDRVEALGGRIAISSPPGKGTTIGAEMPVRRDG